MNKNETMYKHHLYSKGKTSKTSSPGLILKFYSRYCLQMQLAIGINFDEVKCCRTIFFINENKSFWCVWTRHHHMYIILHSIWA